MTKRRIVVTLAMLVYVLLLIGVATTALPYVDESWYAMPAWNLATHGSFGTPVIETSASPMPGMPISLQGIRSHTYWIMVFPMILKAGWFKIVGFSLLTTRLFTAFWAAVALAAWFFIMRRVGGGTLIALLALALIGTDYLFVLRAVMGRDDMMSAALGYAGILAYLTLRERSLYRAVLFSSAFIAAAGLTHPNGGLVGLAGLIAMTLYLDRQRINWRHLAVGMVPYAIGAGLMSIYILQAPKDFVAQFLGNTSGRFPGLSGMASLIPREIGRYLNVYGFDNPTLSGRSKIIILAMYIAGMVAVCVHRGLRKRYRVILLLAGAYVGTLTFFENYKVVHYALYVVPFLAALTAAALNELRAYRPRMATAVIAGMIVFNLGVTGRVILRNGYRSEYLPAIQYLKTHGSNNGLVMASSEAGFGYGFRDNLVDDIRLGYNSKKRPDMILVDSRYRDFFDNLKRREPDVYRYIEDYLQSECVPVKVNEAYTVYVHRTTQAGGGCLARCR